MTPVGGGRPRGTRLLGLLALAAAVLMVVDARAGSSPVDPGRAVVGTVVGPFESAASGAVRPFRSAGRAFHSNSRLRNDVATLQSQNSDLRSELASDPVDRNRLAEYDGLVRAAHDTGYTLVPAHVVGIGPGQSFTRTVTIDAGTTSGVRPDSTVVTKDGLVGRVLRSNRSTATVLLIADSESVVGGRLGSTMKIGFIRGRGAIGAKGLLDLNLVDGTADPQQGDSVVSWGSGEGGPYVAGIPIGKVVEVRDSPRDLSKNAVIAPYVDFGALDLVGVVVPDSTSSNRSLIHADGGLR